jgi:(heptosyl)LPS beta-1,4-glucosyltransferase
MPAISVVIVCANVEDTLPAACRSVAWADEIIVVDSGSTDRTAEIARDLANRYVLEPWRGYTAQKVFGAELARNDWVFILDGDEACSPELAAEWGRLDDAALDAADVLIMPRRNYVMGRYARAWAPDWQSRIYHRRRATWPDEALHDARLPSDPARIRRLKGWIEHKRHSCAGWADYFSGRRADERLLMVARDMHRRGKRARWWDIAIRPALAFAKFYFIKGGWRDGTFGLLIAQKALVSDQLKYAALWAVQNGLDTPAPNPPADTTDERR